MGSSSNNCNRAFLCQPIIQKIQVYGAIIGPNETPFSLVGYIECWLGSFVISRRGKGWVVRTTCPPLDPLMESIDSTGCILLKHHFKLRVILSYVPYGIEMNIINGPRHEKTCLRGFANTTGADQPAHTRSLISAFVIRF